VNVHVEGIGVDVRPVHDLIRDFERGEIRIPEMQRDYVWKPSQVRDFFDSLYRGYPTGSILLWDADIETTPLREAAVPQKRNLRSNAQFLMDGQQRLTSLASVIRKLPADLRDDTPTVELLFNLEHPDKLDNARTKDDADFDNDPNANINNSIFIRYNKSLAQSPHWVNVVDVFDPLLEAPDILKRKGYTETDPEWDKYRERIKKLKNTLFYSYPVHLLPKSFSYEEMTRIFVRINSKGTGLWGSQLSMAEITSTWRGSREIFQAFQKKCRNGGFDLNEGVHVRNLLIFATGKINLKATSYLSKPTLQKAWIEACGAMDYALNFLRNNAKIDSHKLLSSTHLVLILAYLGYSRIQSFSSEEQEQMRYWVRWANAKSIYASNNDKLINQDIAAIQQNISILDFIKHTQKRVIKHHVEAGDLEVITPKHGLFKTMRLAFEQNGAQDWRTGLRLSSRNSGDKHQLEDHHIFPKALLLKAGYNDREIYDVANFAFIESRTNKYISDKEPKNYFPELLNERGGDSTIFSTQAIPYQNRELLEVENYKAFLVERRKLIAKALNEFIGYCP